MRAFVADLIALRYTHAWQQDGDTHGGCAGTLVVAQLKCAWVDDFSCFIWQVRSPATAAVFLVKCATS